MMNQSDELANHFQGYFFGSGRRTGGTIPLFKKLKRELKSFLERELSLIRQKTPWQEILGTFRRQMELKMGEQRIAEFWIVEGENFEVYFNYQLKNMNQKK